MRRVQKNKVLSMYLFTDCSIDQVNSVEEINNMDSKPIIEIFALENKIWRIG